MNKKIFLLFLIFLFFLFFSYAQKEIDYIEDVVLIPAGEFTMGGDEGSSCPKCTVNRLPKHKVYLSAYYIDKYEVTNSQYKKCVEAGKCKVPHFIGFYAHPKYVNHPVVYVDWYQADNYCKWRGKRLPTEAEWEKAARGTDERIYPWGNTWNKNNCNNWNYSGPLVENMAKMDNGRGTLPVGSIKEDSSFYGVMDMAGNVIEWVQDWYDENYYKNSPLNNPQGSKKGEFKILRGGHWTHNVEIVFQTTNRIKAEPEHWYFTWGFRCVRDLGE